MDVNNIIIDDYDYPLPEERIAKFPLEQRDQAKLLLYRNEQTEHKHFFDLPDLLPDQSLLFFNDTKVIPARMHFKKLTGTAVEIFFLNPFPEGNPIEQEVQRCRKVTWKCLVGNKKRWKAADTLSKQLKINHGIINIKVIWHDRENDIVRLEWDQDVTLANILEAAGEVPLPPYLKREATPEDKPRYQTVYSQHQGAIAAPTAGLHFTPELIQKIEKSQILTDRLTLHVGAGTFQPVKEKVASQHPMHSEQIVVRRRNLDNLLKQRKPIVAVGTTSMRTLESIYWYGVSILIHKTDDFVIPKLIAYQDYPVLLPEPHQAIMAVLDVMDQKKTDVLLGQTEIYIMPGYEFKIVDALITNFHLPKSTLMLLIAAFVGDDWKKIYSEALDNRYRFLSYGDSSLLFGNPQHSRLPI